MNLFKLTKDGKCMGYMKITETVLFKLPAKIWSNAWILWEPGDIDFDQAHPYVCEDKNGDKVFAGDETNHGAVAWDSKLLAWVLLENVADVLGDSEVTGIKGFLASCLEDIELIKDKDNVR